MSENIPAGKARPLRHLQPRPISRAGPTTTGLPPKSRLHNVAAACDACRKRKSKCSGERPSCRRCAQRHMPCVYTTQAGETSSQAFKRSYDDLQARVAVQQEVIQLLKDLPDDKAQNVLQMIRSGADVLTIANQVKAADLLLQLAVAPETRYRYEFPYRSEMPQNHILNNPYLNSLLYEAASLYASAQHSEVSQDTASTPSDRLSSTEYQDLYLKPFHAAQVVEPLLSDAKPSLWTAVCDDDVLMRELLAVFFRCEYQFTMALQKDYFLQDMAAKRQDFCSSLLVNIMLAYSCVCYQKFANRAEYWNPHTLVYRFHAEARRLWELEATRARITTIQAGMLFNVFHNLCGLDEVGQAYRIQAIALAHEMRLFDGPIKAKNDRLRNGMVFNAWALYSWEALVGFSFMLPPLLTKAPDETLPDPSEDTEWYGEIWVRYPMSQSLSPIYFGQVFKAKCQFRIIMSDFCTAAYSKGVGVPLDKANSLYLRLKSWYDSLPGPLLPKTIVLPAHLQLHLYYYNMILALYEPLLDTKTVQDPSPQELVAEASRYLQTVIRLYYLRHGFDSMDLFIVIPLMLAGFQCTNAIDEKTPAPQLEDLRSTLILVTQGLHSQRRNHYLAEALFRVIRGRMRAQELNLLRNSIKYDEDEVDGKQAMVQAVRSHWPVSVVRKKEDLDSHILGNLVEKYVHLNVEEESGTA